MAGSLPGYRLVAGVLLCLSVRVDWSILDVLRLLAAGGSSAAGRTASPAPAH